MRKLLEESLVIFLLLNLFVSMPLHCSANDNSLFYNVNDDTLSSSATNLEIDVIDEKTGETIPARILVKDFSGQSYVPENSVTLNIGQETWFMSPGNSTITTNSKKLTVRVERGKEYERIKKEIQLHENNEKLEIVLKRWIHMEELGYLSAENHLHRHADDVAALCAAEDLSLGTTLQWWNYPRFGVPKGDGHQRKIQFDGITTPVSVYDVEIEEEWGALYIINLPNPFPFVGDKKMPNLPGAKYAHERGALNCYQAGWSREVLIDALLGYVDVVNICNNNFHMHRYQPRSRYSNLLNVEGFPVYPDTPEGMMQMNNDTYYRLLNCGLKLAAGAGSATGAKENPVGFSRAYIRSKANDGINEVYANWKDGKNFVTNGPMLFLSTSEGKMPGDSLSIDGKKKVLFHVKVNSDSPIGKVELVANGKVIKRFDVAENVKQFAGEFEAVIDKSGWVCARCTDTDMHLSDEELETYRGPRKEFYQDPNRLRFAHTSPIYLYVDGKDIDVKSSILEGLKMIEAFRHFCEENVSEEYRDMMKDAVDKSEHILKSRLEKQ